MDILNLIGSQTNMIIRDNIQISRWKAFGPRHIGGITKNCPKNLLSCRRKQRQALLQWAYNPFF